MFRARTNTLSLGWRGTHTNVPTNCPMCGREDEDLEHFILQCSKLQELRIDSIILQQPYPENTVY